MVQNIQKHNYTYISKACVIAYSIVADNSQAPAEMTGACNYPRTGATKGRLTAVPY